MTTLQAALAGSAEGAEGADDPAAPLGICTATLRADPFSCSPDELQSIITASGLAGFRTASLWRMHYELAKAGGLRDGDLVQWLTEAELQVLVVEAGVEWANGVSDALATEADALFALARVVGATHLLAVTLHERADDFDPVKARAGLRSFADRAADVGLSLSVEWLPWTVLPTLSSAWELIQSVDRDNVGLVFDNWHWLRQPGGPQPDVMRTIPGARFHLLQLCDAPATPEGAMLEETMTRRLLPGEGATDWAELAEVFAAIGARPIVAPEPFNGARAAQGPTVYAHAIAEATRRVLAS
jgi:sugar phosphate isomerase/epimerase